jgi:hypothetical protein
MESTYAKKMVLIARSAFFSFWTYNPSPIAVSKKFLNCLDKMKCLMKLSER